MTKAKMQRTLALLLAIIMCIGLLPMHVLAADVEEPSVQTAGPSEGTEGPVPVHYYTFDESADAEAADSGTGKVAGTKNGAVGSTEGKAGNAAFFDGSSYIDVDDKAILNGENFTVTAWINWNGDGRINTIAATSVSGIVEGMGLLFYVHGDGGGVVKAGDGVGAEFNSTGVVKTNEWTHVAFVKDGSTARLYINGQVDGESNDSQTGTSLRSIRIGANHNTDSHNFHGAIDEVKIFDQALTAEQIAAAMELPGEETPQERSSLKTHEVTIADADWGKSELTIEAELVEGDSIAKVTNVGSDSLTGENGKSVSGGTITLNSDFFKAYSEETRTVELEVTFGKGNKDTYTIKRGDPTKRYGWSLQKQATGEEAVIPEGWITKTDNGIVVDHSKMIVDSNHQGWVLYYADGDKLTDSVWEFDMTLTNPDSNQVGFINIAPAPRTVDGNNYEGIAIDTPAALQRTGRKNGGENYGGVTNMANLTFDYGTTYHFRIVTEGSHMTTYVTVPGGEEQKLAEFDSPIGLGESTCGFRIWRGGKTIKIENMQRKKLVKTGFEDTMVQVEKDNWGKSDVVIPYNCEEGDSIQSVANGQTALTEDDYTAAGSVLTVKADYIKAQTGTFSLKVTFANGYEATLWIMRHETGILQEYIWTPDQGIDMWMQMSGDGTFEMGEDKAGEVGLHVKGKNLLVNTLAPMAANGEVELTFQLLSDTIPWAGAGGESSGVGTLFRAEDATHYQAVDTHYDINVEPCWDFCKNGNYDRIIWDGHHFESMESVKVYDELQDKYVVKDIKLKVRYYKDSITLWVDDEFCHTQNMVNATEAMGNTGLVLGRLGDILVKKAVFREIAPFEETESTEPDIIIEADGLTVRLDGEFPRVIDYTLNGKKMNGAELSYHYATVNNTDYPATATTKDQTADSVTYHVVPDPERTGVTFDVKFTVLPDQILEMLILNIHEPTDEMVFGIGLPQLPMISANSNQSDAALNASWINKNSRCYQDRNVDITKKDVSTTAAMGVTLPIISADGLSASMFNNVFIGGDEYNYKGFELADGSVSVGVWNTEWVYRGMDNKKMLPFPSEPEETELYCRVVITEDTNGDNIVNWQDGANALKKLTDGITPGADQAARSFFHVGYNFSSGTQQPFLQVADNMKRLSNLIDGFGQQLIFKGYANEGHDSGHSDFQDINRRAGGAEDMNVAIAEADKINSNFGIHINEHEIYPEAKMFNDHTAAGQDAWYWMDHSKILRRYVDMLDTTMENHFESRMEQLFEKTPDLDFVYVDCWGEDRWGEKKLIGTMLENGAELFGNENAADFTRFGVWTHSTHGNNSPIHQFVYNSQKDIYQGSGIYWGGYNRAASMMSWQHNNNINTLEAQFFTNQLPQKYLMCHDVRRVDNGVGYFTGNITSSNYIITKDGNKLTDGQGKIFIPWYAEDSETKDPDEAAKIYHWNSAGGKTEWTLPKSWDNVTEVYLYKTTQTGKVLVETLTVTGGHQVTIDAEANTGYVLYPAAAKADVTDWSTGSPLKDTMFNSRDDSIWKQSGEAEIAYNDDGNGVSILTITGTEDGQVSQTMTGLTVGQKYRVTVWAGAANGKTARITVKQDGKTYENYVGQVMMNCNYFDDYARGKAVQRMWVDFTATSETAEVILSGDACENATGQATFMQSRMVKTAEPDLPNGCVANETFEYVEQGAYGIFSPEGAADGGPHLSETHLPYTTDTITGDWSLKLYGARGQGAAVRTNPSTMRLKPNASYVMEFNTLGNGWVIVQSESDGEDVLLRENTTQGSHSFIFTTGSKTDYIVRINCSVLDDFVVYEAEDDTPPTAPTNLTAEAVDSDNAVILTWEAATDDDGQVGSYRIYRNGGKEPIAIVKKDTLTYTDRDTLDETEYTYQVSAVNLGQTEGPKSNEATVTTNILPPEAVSGQIANSETITITFNKAMDKTSAETLTNYTLTGMVGAQITGAKLSADGRTVALTIDGLDMTGSVTVTAANVKDAAGKGTMAEKSFECSLIEHYFKLDEAANAVAVDETGHKNGTKLGDVTSVEGKVGQAANFNGKSYIEVESDALSRPDAFTVAAWIKWDGSSGVNAIVGNDVSGNASSVGIIFFVDGGSGVLRTNSNLCAVVGSSDKRVTANEWHHVAFVKNIGSAQVYLDGEMIGSADVQFGKEAKTPIRIGGSSGQNPSYPFHGAIDEVKIFSAGLSEADIALLAGQQLAPTPNAKFNAMTMTLSDVAEGMSYSVDKGVTWVDITGTTADLSEAAVTVSNGIWVKRSGDGETTADSRIQVITLTQAAMPEGIAKTDETVIGAKDGTITGVTAAMEYSADGGETWIDGTGKAITGLAPQDYLVRTKATADALASEPLVVTIAESAVEKIMLTIDHSGLVDLKCGKDAQGDLDEHQVEYGETTAITLVPVSEYYALPAQDAIEITNAAGDRVTGWTIDGNGVITFPDGITSSLIIRATGVVKTYAVSYTLTNGLSTSDAAGRVAHKAAYTGKLVAANGYRLPESITLTMGGEEFTGFTYENGILTIAEGKITGDLDITASGIADGGSSSGPDQPFIPPVIKPDEGKDGEEIKDDEEIEDPDAPLADLPFIDVAKDAWYAQSVANIYAKGYMKGTGELTFAPKLALNRGMMAQIIHNMAENPSASAGAPFTDLNGKYYTEAVAWGAANGVLKGYSEELFGGEDDVTREQMVVMLYRYAQSLDLCKEVDLSVLDGYTDGARVSGWAKEAVAWAVENGLLQGRGNNDLDPRANITRAEVAAVLDRFSKLFLV